MNELPSSHDLLRIKEWNILDSFALFDLIKELWLYPDLLLRAKWYPGEQILLFEMSTGGWSYNEAIIGALLANKSVTANFHSKWERGGHYQFQIKASVLGFKPIASLAKELGVSRQNIHQQKNKDRYEVLLLPTKIKYVRKITPKPTAYKKA